MKLVFLSQRVDFVSDRNETRDAIDQKLMQFVLEAGYLPLQVPNSLLKFSDNGECNFSELEMFVTSIIPCAIILSGGNDLGQSIQRDLTEGFLLNFAKDNKIPALGICRGMQMMAHWAGAHIHPVTGHVRTRHFLNGQILQEVNSYHTFSIAECPHEFDILAYSEDGQIEAFRHKSLPWEGWMWHPEREQKFSQEDIHRVRSLFGT